jgi:hypothetical protein
MRGVGVNNVLLTAFGQLTSFLLVPPPDHVSPTGNWPPAETVLVAESTDTLIPESEWQLVQDEL